MQSVPNFTNAASSNAAHGEVCPIHHYVIKHVSDLQQVDGFLLVLRFPPHKIKKEEYNNALQEIATLQQRYNNLKHHESVYKLLFVIP
jgi:nitrogen fixation/metabolism regulation signal transduction histidine kinase